MPKPGRAREHAAHVERGGPFLVRGAAARRGQQPPGPARLRARAVGHRVAEVGHLARSRQHAAAALAEQPGLERVEAHGPAPRRARSLVQHDHPREPLPVLVRDEDLEAGVRLRAARVVAHQAEGGHARAPEIPERTRVRAVLVPERAAVARVARRVPGGPLAPAALDRVAVVHPLPRRPACRRRGRLRVVDGVGRPGGGRGEEQGYHRERQESHGSRDTLASVMLRPVRCSMFKRTSQPMTPRALFHPARLARRPVLSTQSDERLVDLVRAGSDPAFEAIVERYRRALMRYVSRLLPPERAEDVVQQSFVKAYEAMHRDSAELNLRPWLYRIAHNGALNALRDRGARPRRARRAHRRRGAPRPGVRALRRPARAGGGGAGPARAPARRDPAARARGPQLRGDRDLRSA